MLKLNVGLSRKIGEANYGSRGASVHLELEVETALVNEPDALRERVRQLFRMARSSVDEELGTAHASNRYDPPDHGNGNGHYDHANGNNYSNGNGSGNGSHRAGGRQATASQVKAIHAIARRQRIDLIGELRSRFGVDRPHDLSIGQASEFIDAIKPPTLELGARR